MKIKTRLMVTYIVALVMPVLLFGLLNYVLNGFWVLPRPDEEAGKAPTSLVEFALQVDTTNVVEKSSRHLQRLMMPQGMEPEKVADVQDALKKLQKDTQGRVAFVVLGEEDYVYYPEFLIDRDIRIAFDFFPAFGFNGDYDNRALLEQSGYSIQRQYDMINPDGEEVRVFVLYGIKRDAHTIMYFVLNNLIAFLLLGVGVMGVINFFVARSITRPLEKLQAATEAVRQGNLDHAIESKGRDKIADLSKSFEQMREQLKENEIERKGYEENRKMMISNISHDLRTPVTAIRLHAEGILDGVAEFPDKLDRYVRSIRQNAEAIDRLLGELTILSNLDMDQEPFHFTAVRADAFLADLVEELQFDYANQNVELSADWRGQSITMKLDVFQIRRVLVNLIDNAVKYGKASPVRIQVTGQERPDGCMLAVSDNGGGVPEDQLEDIFDRFFRGDAARSGTQPGGGLGLSIARNIIERHGGKIWAMNNTDGGLSVQMALNCKGRDDSGTHTDR